MFYIRFVDHRGSELNVSCEAYHRRNHDGWSLITTEHVLRPGINYERNYCVIGENHDMPWEEGKMFVSMFVMNKDGNTIDKIVPHPSKHSEKGR